MRRIYPKRTRVLLSGGMDSAVCLAWAIKHHGHYDDIVDAVCFDYGQRHAAKELEAAKRIASTARVPLTIYLVGDGIGDWYPSGGSLVSDGGDLFGSDVVVPGRNRALIVAAALLHDPELPDALVFGACADDQEVFEDCRPEFFRSVEAELRIPVYTPLIDKTKEEVVSLARTLGATNLIVMSWSCYAGGDTPCKECGACLARAKGLSP
jgi:7-cyano-7-deazaguanine synthase